MEPVKKGGLFFQMNRLKLIFLGCLLFGGRLPAVETPVYWEYFEPEVDYTRRLRIAGGTSNWEIVKEPTPEKTGSSLKLTFDLTKQKKNGLLIFDLPMTAFDRISFRVWNPNPPTLPVYLHLNIFRSTSLGAFQESLSFFTRYYGGSTVDTGLFIRPGTPSAPLPTSTKAGWIPVEVRLPQDITDVGVNGKRRPLGNEEQTDWKKYAFPTVSLIVETKPSGSSAGPFSLYIDDVEFYLSK